jgi:hypothetical protein
VVEQQGTGVSSWSLGMRRWHRTRTRGGQHQEGAPAVALPDDTRWLACAAATCGGRRE